MRDFHDLRHRVDLCHHVRTMREADQPHLVVQQGLQIFGVQVPCVGVDLPLPHLETTVRQPPPRAGVGLMILVRHNDRIPGPHLLREGLRQHIGILGGGRPEGKLMRFHAQHGRQPPARLVHLFARKAARLVGGIGLHLALRVEPREPVDDLTTGERPARVLEKGLPLQGWLGEGGELVPHECAVEFH